tara:strand:+ start:344 stop:655 length:312 start_codon:yes stop_codon:yes gene_type:complete
MNLSKLNSVIKKIDQTEILDELKEAVKVAESSFKEELNKVKEKTTSSIKDKILYYLDDEKGKKEIIKKVNNAIDIPWISEAVEEKIFTVIFNVISGVIKKVLI